MKKWMGWILCLALLCGWTTGAAAGGQLTVYTAYQEDEAQFLFGEFEKETGIPVRFVRLSAGELFARIQAESENPQASLWFGTSIDTLNVAARSGYLEPYACGVEAIPQALRDPDGFWTPHSLSVVCFASNTRWLEESGASAPTSWAGLLDEAYDDNVVSPHPGTSGMAFTWLCGMMSLMGEDEGIAYLKKLDKHVIQYTKGGSAPARMAGLGETGVGICFSSDAQNAINSGYPLTITYPEEGTPYEVSGMALIKNGPVDERENAQRFIDWAAGKASQQVFVDAYNRLPSNAEVQLPEGMLAFGDIKTAQADRVLASEHRARLIERFETQVRGSTDVLK